MEIRYHDPKAIKAPLRDVPPGWSYTAYGGLKADHFTSVEHREKAKAVHVASKPCINESAFEVHVELSILEALPGPGMVFVECGAGWGGQTLTFHTAIANQVIDTAVKEFTAYAIEAEPGHYRFLVETWVQNRIKGVPIFGAVADHLGWEPFYAERPSASNYGQALHPRGNITVPVFTLANLVSTFSLEEIDLVHMDVQGAEPDVLAGAAAVLPKIRYLIVCPHYEKHVGQIESLLSPTHDLLIGLGPRSGYHTIEGFPLPIHMPQDGIMVWKRR